MNSESWQQAESEPRSMQSLQHPNPGWGPVHEARGEGNGRHMLFLWC